MKQHKLIFFLLLLLFAACDDKRVFEANKVFSGESWNKDEVAVFKVPVRDTITPHRFFFTLRNRSQYPFSNLFLFLTTKYPDQTFSVDTIEILLADPSGKWLGSGSGDVYENRVLFRNNVVFPDTGEYLFAITHGMRMDDLPHILDAGLRIESQ